MTTVSDVPAATDRPSTSSELLTATCARFAARTEFGDLRLVDIAAAIDGDAPPGLADHLLAVDRAFGDFLVALDQLGTADPTIVDALTSASAELVRVRGLVAMARDDLTGGDATSAAATLRRIKDPLILAAVDLGSIGGGGGCLN